MKRIALIVSILLVLCGCGQKSNSLIETDYINKNNYKTIYNDLLKASNDINYIPSKETEENYYELIEVISDNCLKFSKNELSKLNELINYSYQFQYSKSRYTNDNYQTDLNEINKCLVE